MYVCNQPNSKSSLNVKNKILLYRICIRPIMTYGCQIWSTKCAKTHLKKLQIIQNKNIKIIYNLRRRYPTIQLHRKYKEDMFLTVTSKITQRFEDRNRNSIFDIIREFLKFTTFSASAIKLITEQIGESLLNFLFVNKGFFCYLFYLTWKHIS